MIIVTAANGKIGSRTVKQLAAAHHQVRALVRDPAKASDLAAVADVVTADLADPGTLSAAFAGAERVFVIAPLAPQLETLEANVFRAAAEAGAEHVVKLSNLAAGTLPTAPFSWHEASENALRDLGIPWTILRPTRFMTDMPFSWDFVTQNSTILESTGDGAISLIDPHDVAAVAATVLTTPGHEGKIYELTCAEALTGAQIAQKIAAAIGRPVTFDDPSPEVFRETMLGAGTPQPLVDMLEQYMAFIRQGGGTRVTTTVADLLGRPPRSYDEWLADNARARMPQ